MARILRVMAVGLPAATAHQLIDGSLPVPLAEVRTLGAFEALPDFLAMGPDLKVDLLLWAGVPVDPITVGRALQPLHRLRPRCGVLLLANDADQAAVGMLTADLHERRRRGEIPPALAATRRDLGPVLRRLLAELGWPAAGPDEPLRRKTREPAAMAGPDARPKGAQHNMAMLLQGAGAPAELTTAPPVAAEAKGPRAKVVVCFGPKGGVGKTTVAVSLATLAARARPGKVVLLDLDLTAADASVHLGHFAGPDLVDILPQLSTEPPAGNLVFHQIRGLDLQLAAAPQRPELAELVRPQHVERLLGWLRQSGMVTIVDTPAGFGDDVVYQALLAADHLVLVTTADPAALRQVGLALEFMNRLEVAQAARRWLVLSQVSPQSPISTARIESFLGHPICGEIPLDRLACERAVAAGRPLLIEEPAHPISRAMGRLGNHFGWLQGELNGRSRPGWMARTIAVLTGRRRTLASRAAP